MRRRPECVFIGNRVMNAPRRQGEVVTRILAAICVALFAGFWGLITLFSDYPPDWSYARWALYVLSSQVIAGFIIGLLLPLRWQLSLAASWGAILISIAGFAQMLRSGGLNSQPPASFLARFAFPVFTVLVIPGAIALAGYAGSRVAMRWSRNSTTL
jgi:hypothetical protein